MTERPQPKAPFELRYTADAGADIQGLDGSVRKQLRKVLEKKLAVDPEGYGLPLRGPLTNYWKHEFGNHRVIYRIYAPQRMVVVCAVGIRKQGDVEDIYRQLESVAQTGRLAEQLASVLKNLLPGKK
jgi:mRNA-degrading endonuclease RelE of RelBE toxin-antitoxin system